MGVLGQSEEAEWLPAAGQVRDDVWILGNRIIGWADVVLKTHVVLRIEYSLDDGTTWRLLQAVAPSCWYVMPERYSRLAPPPADYRYDRALEKIACYAPGRRHVANIAMAVTSGIAGELCYDPAERDPDQETPPQHILTAYDKGRAQCSGNSKLMRHILLAAGNSATIVYAWAGVTQDSWDLFYNYGDTDGDGTPDNLDTDDDKDGIPDPDDPDDDNVARPSVPPCPAGAYTLSVIRRNGACIR